MHWTHSILLKVTPAAILHDFFLASPTFLRRIPGLFLTTPGLFTPSIVETFLRQHTTKQYMILICKRASGELQTTATWMREFVQGHPAYRHDSVVSEAIAHDLVMELRAVGEVRFLAFGTPITSRVFHDHSRRRHVSHSLPPPPPPLDDWSVAFH